MASVSECLIQTGSDCLLEVREHDLFLYSSGALMLRTQIRFYVQRFYVHSQIQTSLSEHLKIMFL